MIKPDTLQTSAVIALSLTAAARVLLFDTRQKTHKPLSAFIAWLTVVWLGSLAFSAAFALHNLTCWLLVFGLALHTGAILWSGGNINRLHPQKNRPETADGKPSESTLRRHLNPNKKRKNA